MLQVLLGAVDAAPTQFIVEHFERNMLYNVMRSDRTLVETYPDGTQRIRIGDPVLHRYQNLFSERHVHKRVMGHVRDKPVYAKCYSTGQPMNIRTLRNSGTLLCNELVAKSSLGMNMGVWDIMSAPSNVWFGW